MKVLLKKDVDNLGYAGEVHKVSNGFGRNYLIPNGMAVVATAGTMKQAELWRKKAEARRAELHAEYEALSAQIREVRLVFEARAGESGKLYGSVTTAMIADELNESLGTDIDRRKVGVEPLRQLGEHEVVVRLSGEFQPSLTVVIENEDEEPAPDIPDIVAVADEDIVAEVEDIVDESAAVEDEPAAVEDEPAVEEADQADEDAEPEADE